MKNKTFINQALLILIACASISIIMGLYTMPSLKYLIGLDTEYLGSRIALYEAIRHIQQIFFTVLTLITLIILHFTTKEKSFKLGVISLFVISILNRFLNIVISFELYDELGIFRFFVLPIILFLLSSGALYLSLIFIGREDYRNCYKLLYVSSIFYMINIISNVISNLTQATSFFEYTNIYSFDYVIFYLYHSVLVFISIIILFLYIIKLIQTLNLSDHTLKMSRMITILIGVIAFLIVAFITIRNIMNYLTYSSRDGYSGITWNPIPGISNVIVLLLTAYTPIFLLTKLKKVNKKVVEEIDIPLYI